MKSNREVQTLKIQEGNSHCGAAEMNPTSTHEDVGSWVLSGSGIWRCRELQCRSQTWLRPHVAVAVVQASSSSSNSTPNLRTSICLGCSSEKQKKKKKKKEEVPSWRSG